MEEIKKQINNTPLSKITKTIYIKTIDKYTTKYGNPLNHTQKEIVKNIEKLEDNELPQYVKALCKILALNERYTDKIQELYKRINANAIETAHKNKLEKNDTLLRYDELMKRIENDYSINDTEKQREYIIKCLLVIYNTRNQDLIATIKKNNKRLNEIDNEKNYLILNDNNIFYIRNNYKTSDTYGTKSDIIQGNNHRIYYALKDIIEKGITDLIPLHKISNISKYIKKICYGLTESDILKIILKEQNSLGEASKISHNRGTALTTLQSNYNIVM
jgi:hypothetical protein